MAQWSVLPATGDDLADVVALVNSAYRGAEARAAWTHEADLLDGQRTDAQSLADELSAPDPSTILLLREGSGPSIVACVMLQRYRDRDEALTCHLAMLTVSPGAQARGLGRHMLDVSEAWARQEGCRALGITVISRRVELVAWYERRGFRRTGETRPFPYGDTRFGVPRRDDLAFLVMEKSLGKTETVVPDEARSAAALGPAEPT